MSKDDEKPTALKRRILTALAAGPAFLVAATVVSLPADAQASTKQHKNPIIPSSDMPVDGHTQVHQWWANGWRHPWGNWNNWHNWPNWNNWHNWANW